MSSRAQRRANKQNAQHSTGPRTNQGKQRSSQNALKHGLRSKHPVIPGEDPAEYQRKLDQLRADLRPHNALEEDLVEQIADASWRLKRLARMEAAVESYYIDTTAKEDENIGKDSQQVMGEALVGYGRLNDLAILSRYEGQLSRRHHRAVKELRDLRKGAEVDCFVAHRFEGRRPVEHDEHQYQQQEQLATNQQNAHPSEPTQSTQLPMKPATSDTSATPTADLAPRPNRDEPHPATETSGQPGPIEVIK